MFCLFSELHSCSNYSGGDEYRGSIDTLIYPIPWFIARLQVSRDTSGIPHASVGAGGI